MGYREIRLQVPTDISDQELRVLISKKLKINEFSYQIEHKSLDARKKSDIHFELAVAVSSPVLKEGIKPSVPGLKIPMLKGHKKALIAGSGPAGFFAAYILQKAGYNTTIIERGKNVIEREKSIQFFESGGPFDPSANYAFGEGGAGTFSDGKLTSRSKRISVERQFILDAYINAGAPREIAWMNHPHIGSDNLKIIVQNLRNFYQKEGGEIQFETTLEEIYLENKKVLAVKTNRGETEADIFLLGIGHSAFETFRMLMKKGVMFRPKNFALGSRMEHSRQVINKAQWGREELPGVKAAEYRLTSNPSDKLPVYTFCMCPGGIVVPATAYKNSNIVNGMSLFDRDMKFSNAACVAALNPYDIISEKLTAYELLDWLEDLEMKFYSLSRDYRAPICSISDFISQRVSSKIPESSYPLALNPFPLWEILPDRVQMAMREGLKDFCRKMKGFDTGSIMGLESKTSASIQVLREDDGRCMGFENLYMIGEGSGYSGGIISSGADGIKTALKILE